MGSLKFMLSSYIRIVVIPDTYLVVVLLVVPIIASSMYEVDV